MILVDTNVLVAAGNAAETYHREARDLLETVPVELVVAPMVVAEVCHLIGTRDSGRPAAEALFLSSLAAGDMTLATMTAIDVARMVQLVERYADLGLGGTDASIVVLAERMGIDTIATFDRRHFSVVRTVTGQAFTLLP